MYNHFSLWLFIICTCKYWIYQLSKNIFLPNFKSERIQNKTTTTTTKTGSNCKNLSAKKKRKANKQHDFFFYCELSIPFFFLECVFVSKFCKSKGRRRRSLIFFFFLTGIIQLQYYFLKETKRRVQTGANLIVNKNYVLFCFVFVVVFVVLSVDKSQQRETQKYISIKI